MLGMIRSTIRRLLLSLSTRIDTIQVPFGEYESLQHRPGTLEYFNPRLRIMSTLVWLVPWIERMATDRALGRETIRVLDAGARDGWTVTLFEQLGFLKVTGVELVSELVGHARSQGRAVVRGDIHSLDFSDEQFDVVFCRHTLEHTLDPKKALAELIRVCASGGLIMVSLPIERRARGKHTTAVPNIRLLKQLARGQPVTILVAMRSEATRVIRPDGDEAVLLLRKN
jgi:2-polyprenyl-3-methyl-5-hydroxy-6-metoxy-1,4-benzoquinol methylase